MNSQSRELYRKAFVSYIRTGTPISWSLKEVSATTYYIWRTRGDERVRPEHSANNGKVFSWDAPPDTGHPGEEYGCRCTAESISNTDGLLERNAFFEIMQVIQAEIFQTAIALTTDASVRKAYASEIAKLAHELELEVKAGNLTWAQAAKKASTIRNEVMEMMRYRSSPVGKALAETIKSQGRTLNELVAKYAISEFGEDVDFNKLSQAEKNKIYAKITEASSRSNPAVTKTMQNLGKLGRGLGLLSLGVSVYNIATAEDPIAQTVEEGAILGGGFLGGAAVGAAAGLICGPGAPVCVGIGFFVGGALGALGAGLWFD